MVSFTFGFVRRAEPLIQKPYGRRPGVARNVMSKRSSAFCRLVSLVAETRLKDSEAPGNHAAFCGIREGPAGGRGAMSSKLPGKPLGKSEA